MLYFIINFLYITAALYGFIVFKLPSTDQQCVYCIFLLCSYGDKHNADVAGNICGELLEEYGDDFSEEVIRSM